MVRYKKYNEYKVIFIRELAIKLVKRKPSDIDEKEIMQMINNIRKYLIKRSDFETN